MNPRESIIAAALGIALFAVCAFSDSVGAHELSATEEVSMFIEVANNHEWQCSTDTECEEECLSISGSYRLCEEYAKQWRATNCGTEMGLPCE